MRQDRTGQDTGQDGTGLDMVQPHNWQELWQRRQAGLGRSPAGHVSATSVLPRPVALTQSDSAKTSQGPIRPLDPPGPFHLPW